MRLFNSPVNRNSDPPPDNCEIIKASRPWQEAFIFNFLQLSQFHFETETVFRQEGF